jgi:hypothetical protein
MVPETALLQKLQVEGIMVEYGLLGEMGWRRGQIIILEYSGHKAKRITGSRS